MAREHPSIKTSSSQKTGLRFDGEDDDEEEVNANKQNKVLLAKKTKDKSRLFVKKVNGREERIQFYIVEQDIPWDLSAELREDIEECGGDVVDEPPEEGYTLVDPRSEEGELEIASRSTQTRRVVSFRFIEESIKRGSLVPPLELALFIKGDRPVKFHLHDSLPKDEIARLRDDILLRGGNPDVELSEAQVVIHSKAFRDAAVANRRWRQIELFETSDWLKSCMTMKRFSMTGAGGRLTVRPEPRPKPPAQPGRKPGAPRTEFNEQDDRCLVAWMAYQFGKNQAGRQGNRPYQVLVQEPQQLWWTNRHTWHSWRERYKNKKAHFDPLIIQARRTGGCGPGGTARARPKAVKRKAQDNSNIMDEQPDPEPAKQINRGTKRIKTGSQPEGAPAIKISASQKAREAPRLRKPSSPPREPSYAPPSPDPVSPPAMVEPPREETPINMPEDDQGREDSQSSTQLENGILDEAVFGGGASGAVERHNAELAKVAANEMETEEDGEEYTYDDPDVDVVGVTQVETPPPMDLSASEKDEIEDEESKAESTGESGYDEEVGETGETVLDTVEERLTALANAFGAVLSRVEAYYSRAIESGVGEAAAYDFTEKQLRADSRQEKGASPSPLPTTRETSSIPRLDGQKWVYPSEAQFFAAMARKNHNPQSPDMRVVVPIHNAVNERAWGELLAWEAGRGSEACGGVKLVSFKGRPGDRTPKAWFKTLLGYQAPFDRHDWVIDRCGTRMRYVIDFYTGRSSSTGSGPMHSSQPNVSFYLDVRPAIDNWEGVKMRFERFWTDWTGW
ncbi:unnamed protein product [Rhizoctonia solani]|uniref:holocytochrome-c synthase n=1 Tax=Rhizoctonia solani TaxID=456999 RepID=A0A8H3CZL6_9AGAM|nr:unnamed protein product [Rhizoctonia solani]